MRWSGWIFGLIITMILGLITVFLTFTMSTSVEVKMDLAPAVYDLRDADYPFPIIDQQSCQIGYALAGTELFQATLWQKENQVLMFSANQAKECTWREINNASNPCLSGELVDLINLFSTAGVVSETCNPLYLGDGICVEECQPLYYLTGWQRLSTNQIAAPQVIKQALLEYGPVYTKLNTSLAGFISYNGNGVLYDPTSFSGVDHAVLIVGWDDSMNHGAGSGAWIIKNSYGSDWGENGYGYIAYGSGGIGMESSVITDWKINDPEGDLYFYDAAGFTQQVALGASDRDAYMMALYTTKQAVRIQQIELWTTDAATVSIWVYDRFTNGQLSDLKFSIADVHIPYAGYHQIPVSATVELGAQDEVAVVAYIHNQTKYFPLAMDTESTYQVGKNWYSNNGVNWSTFDPEGFSANVGLRLRTTLPPAPPQPLGFRVSSTSQTAIGLTWLPLVGDFRGYLLERRNPSSLLWERIAEVGPSVTSYQDTQRNPETLYLYRLYAYNLGGLSIPAELSTWTLPYAPAAPSDLQITVLSPVKARIEWVDHSDNETGFRIERQRLGEEWVKITEVASNVQSWTDEGLWAGTMYQYRLFASNAGGDSPAVVSEAVLTPDWPYKISLPIILH